MHNRHRKIGISVALAVFAAAIPATLAGPPLICHPYDIANERSLPWGTGTRWDLPLPSYDVNGLVVDTLALLIPHTPVLVRMETLRRAALYSRKDTRIANELLARLSGRALNAEARGKPDPAAWFDAGYLVESYRQLGLMGEGRVAEPMDGYAWVLRAIRSGGDTASMEFAASLMRQGSDSREHYRRAKDGAKKGSLLARNLR